VEGPPLSNSFWRHWVQMPLRCRTRAVSDSWDSQFKYVRTTKCNVLFQFHFVVTCADSFNIRRRSASSLGWLFWYTDADTPDSSAVPRWGISPVICWRRLSASPICFDIIAYCPTHPSFNHRRSSFSGRCCPTVEHSAAERHVGVVNVCFQETFEDPSLQSSFPPNLLYLYSACAVIVISDTIIDLFYLLLY